MYYTPLMKGTVTLNWVWLNIVWMDGAYVTTCWRKASDGLFSVPYHWTLHIEEIEHKLPNHCEEALRNNLQVEGDLLASTYWVLETLWTKTQIWAVTLMATLTETCWAHFSPHLRMWLQKMKNPWECSASQLEERRLARPIPLWLCINQAFSAHFFKASSLWLFR